MRKRKWSWIMKPTSYEMVCDICGGHNIAWSEYEHMIWCYDCQKDTPGSGGIFDGPVPIGVCELLGLSFDRVDLKTGDRLYLHITKNNKLSWRRKRTKQGITSSLHVTT